MVKTARAVTYGDKKVGEVVEGVLVKYVRKSQHLFRKLDAWAVGVEVWEQAKANGAKDIVVFDQEERKQYKVSGRAFEEDAVPIHFGSHGKQLALPRFLWEVS